MSGIFFSTINLTNLIDHHIALLERFGIKDEEPFALIFFSLENRQEIDNIEMFQRILRRTDAIFNQGNNYIVLLTGTDWNGATEVLSGIQEFLDQKPSDNIVTFPEDGTDSKMLLEKLQEVIEDNCNISINLLKSE